MKDWFILDTPKKTEGSVQDTMNPNVQANKKPEGSEEGKNKASTLDWDKLLTDQDYFEQICKTIEIVKDKEKRRKIAENVFCADDVKGRISEVNIDGVKINYECDGNIFYIKNYDLYKLFQQYGELRKEKKGFSSSLCYWILKQYIYEFLPATVSDFWGNLANISKGLPDIAMQQMGINLRISRMPFCRNAFRENGYEIIAEEINLAIKLLGTYQKMWYERLLPRQHKKLGREANKHILVVVDSIKNPFESMYLKRRYSNYYLVGVYTEERERERRLLAEKEFIQDDIRRINQIECLSEFKKEYKKHSKYQNTIKTNNPENSVYKIVKQIYDGNLYNELPFISQNVERCLEAADIFINNTFDQKSSRLHLKKSLLRYICLIMYPGLVLPTAVERCMQTAYTAKVNSGCISRQVGAVITDANFHCGYPFSSAKRKAEIMDI